MPASDPKPMGVAFRGGEGDGVLKKQSCNTVELVRARGWWIPRQPQTSLSLVNYPLPVTYETHFNSFHNRSHSLLPVVCRNEMWFKI